MNTHTRIHNDTTWLLQAWDPLNEARHKGTPRPWKQTETTPQQQAALDAQARAEKQDHGAFALGESPTPLHLDILDNQQLITRTTKKIAADLADRTYDGPVLAYLTHVRDPNPIQLLTYIQETAPRIPEPELKDHADTIHQLRITTARHFTEVVSGQRLKTECPWCRHEQLRFRSIGHEDNLHMVVRCESGVCQPPSADCGAWTGRGLTLPTWPIHEWEWLAGRLNHHNPPTPKEAS